MIRVWVGRLWFDTGRRRLWPGHFDKLRTGPSTGSGRTGRQGQYFEGIEPEVWEFRIGGYQPMAKWLKERKGQTLGFEDLTHCGRMAAALRERIWLMREIDRVEVGTHKGHPYRRWRIVPTKLPRCELEGVEAGVA